MAIKTYNGVRFSNRIDSYSKWRGSVTGLEKGEFGIVIDEANGNYIVCGTGDTTTSFANAVKNSNNIFYSAAYYEKNPPTIELASQYKIGGIKLKTDVRATGGLKLVDGSLTNSLLEWDNDNKRYNFTGDLHVENLSYGNKTETLTMEGDTITIRSGAESNLNTGEYAGIIVNNVNGGNDGFFGLSYNNMFTIERDAIKYETVLLPAAASTTTGFVKITPKNPIAEINTPAKLTLQTDRGDVTYDPASTALTCNLHAPVINVGGSSFSAANGEYNIVLDGGLSPENKEKLQRLDQLVQDVDTLETKVINSATGSDKITVTWTNQTLNVSHNKQDVIKVDDQHPHDYAVRTNENQSVWLPAITGLEVDEYGHLKGYTITNYRIYYGDTN